MSVRIGSLALAGALVVFAAGPSFATETDASDPAALAPARSTRTVRHRHVSMLPPERPIEFRTASAEPAAAPVFPLFAAFAAASTPAAPAAEPAAQATPSANPFATLFGGAPAQPRGELLPPLSGRSEIDAMITKHARLNGVPEALVHRIVIRESKYNPRAVGRGGAMGLMQIKTATARALGYTGGPAGLLDAETNLTYGVKYLAGAYRTAGGNHDRAVSHYARGYYYEAKRRGTLETASASAPRREADATPTAPTFASLFSTFPSAADTSTAR